MLARGFGSGSAPGAVAGRILMRGGVFLYPRDTKDMTKPGRLRLLYEASSPAQLRRARGLWMRLTRVRLAFHNPAAIIQVRRVSGGLIYI